MEGFGRGEARCSDGDARMVQLVRYAVASTVGGVILAMHSDGGARTPVRLHGWRTNVEWRGHGHGGCCMDELHGGELGTARVGARRRACGAAAGAA
jgi:hypothetical protein